MKMTAQHDALGQPKITLRYHLRDDDEWREREVSFAEFFGGGASEPADLFHDVDWVPQHAAVDLLEDIEATDVAVTEVTFRGLDGERLTIKETFWNHGYSRYIEICSQIGADIEPYTEVIFDLRREAGETYELIRLSRENGAMIPVHHAVSHAGGQRDVTLFPAR